MFTHNVQIIEMLLFRSSLALYPLLTFEAFSDVSKNQSARSSEGFAIK